MKHLKTLEDLLTDNLKPCNLQGFLVAFIVFFVHNDFMQKKVNKKLILQISLTTIALLGFLAFMILALCDYDFKMDHFNIVVANNRNSFWSGFFKIFTDIGSFYCLAAMSIVAVILIWFVKKDKRMAIFYAVCFAIVCFSNVVLKRIVRRIRPEHLMIIEETGFSFPSGHAMMTFAFFFLLAHFLWVILKNKTLKISLVVLCAFMIELVSFSRIYLGVHYLSDILAGWLITFAICVSALMVYNSKIFRKKKVKNEEN